MLSIEAMQARFHANRGEVAQIRAKSDPLRAEYDQLCQANRAAEQALSARIKEAEADLYDLEMESGRLVRALSGKTGRPPQA